MKKCKFFLPFLLIFAFLIPGYASEVLHEAESVPQPPELSLNVYGAILLDADTEDVVYTYNADEILYPASTTKLMTAYLTMKYGDPYGWITVPQGIYTGMSSGASNAELQAGEEMYVYELLQCMLIASANEAANALAIYISGSIEAFVDLMNEEALALGCENTHFVNTNGLHDSNHYTTPRDLSKIALAACQYELLVNICASTEVTIRETNLSEERTIKTTNYLIPDDEYPGYGYYGAYGLKTGFTTPAGACLVALCYRDGKTLLSVVLGAEKVVTATETIVGSFPQTHKLLNWGFENYYAGVSYESYLASRPEPPPEPSPTVSPEPSPEPTPEAVPESEPTPQVSAEPEVSPSLSARITLEPDPMVSPEPQETPVSDDGWSEQVLVSAADSLGLSVETLLIGVFGISVILLVVVLSAFVCILRKKRKNR